MQILQRNDAISFMNYLGAHRIPFLFIIDFDEQKPVVIPLRDIDPTELKVDFPNWNNLGPFSGMEPGDFSFSAVPVSFDRYAKAFDLVQQHIRYGDSFLLNLTFPTFLQTELTTRQIFQLSRAPYRLWWRDHFTCFSPEPFVRIRNNQIGSFPMKGTIPADLADAGKRLLSDPKEKAEHATIVDLIRNDLSRVAQRVRVARFRYLEKVNTRKGGFWQSSSEITGDLPADFHTSIGTLLFNLLPAGSISGAPKPKTVEIIKAAEAYQRGYYTGIAGVFDGYDLDSAVLIRYIEECADGLYFKSGGGITALSKVEDEYRELIRKVDLPVKAGELIPA